MLLPEDEGAADSDSKEIRPETKKKTTKQKPSKKHKFEEHNDKDHSSQRGRE